jgi:hypothetical protein
MAQHNRNNWHHIPGIGGIMATGLSTWGGACFLCTVFPVNPDSKPGVRV